MPRKISDGAIYAAVSRAAAPEEHDAALAEAQQLIERALTRWIKVPGPGQFRGEGEWKDIREAGCPDADWEWNRETGYLPTHEGELPPRGEE